MDDTIDAMGRLVDYEIAEVTAAATYYMAETYFDFSRSLIESERPTDLQPAELKEYELALDEEAFPFEEKAISVHEKNMELLRAGVFNGWTEKSLGRLSRADAGPLRETGNEQRLPRRHRQLHVPHARVAGPDRRGCRHDANRSKSDDAAASTAVDDGVSHASPQ